MSELVAELRNNADEIGIHWALRPILSDAADEIERLRADVTYWRRLADNLALNLTRIVNDTRTASDTLDEYKRQADGK